MPPASLDELQARFQTGFMLFSSWHARRFSLLLLLTAGLTGRRAAAADGVAADAEGAAAASVSALRVGTGCGFALGLTDVEERGGDVIAIAQTVYLELTLAPSYQLTDSWAMGPRASWGVEGGKGALESSDGAVVDIDRHLWQLAVEGRYQPGAQRRFYGAANAGMAGAMDRVGGESAWQWAPLVGVALGYDGHVTGPLSLGVELRGAFAAFGSEGARLTRGNESQRYVYGQSAFVGVNLTAILGL